MVAAQGGDLSQPLDMAKPTAHVLAPHDGTIGIMNAQRIGEAVIELGGGRRVKTDTINHCVGLQVHVRIGDPVQRGQPLVDIHADREDAERIVSWLHAAIPVVEDAA